MYVCMYVCMYVSMYVNRQSTNRWSVDCQPMHLWSQNSLPYPASQVYAVTFIDTNNTSLLYLVKFQLDHVKTVGQKHRSVLHVTVLQIHL